MTIARFFGMLLLFISTPALGRNEQLHNLKQETVEHVQDLGEFTQQMVAMIFSFRELGFQKFETSGYPVTLLKENGFEVEEGMSGMHTAWGDRTSLYLLSDQILTASPKPPKYETSMKQLGIEYPTLKSTK